MAGKFKTRSSASSKIIGSSKGKSASTGGKSKSKAKSKTKSSRSANKQEQKSDTILTYPTVGATIFDVPEPASIDGKFTYNYFLPSERVSRDTRGTDESFERHGNRHARFITVTFSKLQDTVTLGTDQSSMQFSFEEKRKILEFYHEKIDSELDYTGKNFSAIILQDSEATKQVQMAVEAGLRLKKIETANLSPLETVLKYNSSTSDRMNGQSILNYTDVEGNNEYTYLDPTTGEPYQVQQPGDVGNLSMTCFLNNKFVADILKNSETAPFSPLFESIAEILSTAKETQNEAISKQNSNFINAEDYEPVYDPINMKGVNIDSILVSGNTLLGYMVEKEELDSAGKAVFKDTVYIVNPALNTYTDLEVKYGVTYRYSISSIYLVRFFDFEFGTMVSIDVLVSSRQSPFINVVCAEAKPPEPPVNLSFSMGQDRKFCLLWDYPFNPQEDIKYFQVFRRNNLEEPFTLIAELDFDNSHKKTKRSEFIPQYAKIKLPRPQTHYIDGDFTLDTEYIYAICCVDAHDLSSPYSEQFTVKWDRSLAKLQVELVSYSGAPKPYPNFNLRASLTSDSIKDSRHHKLTVYFDPEYLKIRNSSGEDMQHLKTDDNIPTYKIQLINLDRQASRTLKIKVKDLT